MTNWKEHLSSLYFNPKLPSSYLGPKKLYQLVKSQAKLKIGRHCIRKWLQDQEAYSLTRGARRKYIRSRVIVAGIDSQWDMDLMDMVDIAKLTDIVKYVLVVIDMGELTNELETGEHIISFVSGGPKNYAYKTKKGNETCKVRGFPLNFTNIQLINFESVKTLLIDPPKNHPLPSPILIKYVVIREKENCIIEKKRKTIEWCTQKDDDCTITIRNPMDIEKKKTIINY